MLKNLKTGDLQVLYNQKLEKGRADGKKGGLSPKSVRYIHTVIHAALEQAVKERIIGFNPAKVAVPPRKVKKEKRVFGSAEIGKFLKYAKSTKYYAAYLLVMATGMRRGELLALRRKKDIDLQNGKVTISRNLVRTNAGLIFQEPKTKNSVRTVGIPGFIIKELQAHFEKQDEKKSVLGSSYKDNDLAFCADDGSPLDPRSFTRFFERLVKKAGLPKIAFHDLRHTFVTMAIENGVSLKGIQEIVGHHDPAYTASEYSHVTTEKRKETTELIGNLLVSYMEKSNSN